ncbi:MAG: hypothetical protein NT094_00205 [Candidatus Staskawiczbacteria bacterium]|nr:hypothetical protein [Candidatus Staskawiczbacteria bacterium]
MVTVDEETQAKEFLKRAEVRTMRKDLRAIREGDALKERDKIAHIKTLEEQRAEQQKKLQEKETIKAAGEKAGLEEVLLKNEGQERIAEKDLKDYATEQERQQIFLLESQRLNFEKEIDEIDKEKDPALKIEKNKLMLQKRDWQAKLNSILEEEKKLENEQKFTIEKQQVTTIASQRKGLEESRWDLDKKIQDTEKKRWESEKQIKDLDSKVSQIDKSSEQLVADKNFLRDKVLGVDKSLREIFSVVMAREEEKRRGEAQEQIARREAIAKARALENEKVQRQQYSSISIKKQDDEGFLSKIPKPGRERLIKISEGEEEQRKKFMHDVEGWSQRKEDKPTVNQQVQPQKNTVPTPASKTQSETKPIPPKPTVPPTPVKKT